MESTTSADGSVIAFDRAGSGEVIVFASGAFNDRTTCAPLAEQLQDRYTTVCYDRRGRGASTDAGSVAGIPTDGVRREIEDLAAVIDAVGGTAAVFGFSSGGVLALWAAAAGLPIDRIALYEPPFKTGPRELDLPRRLAELIIEGRPGDAVATFQSEGIGLPAELIEQIRHSPGWPYLEGMAPSVVYDATMTSIDRPTSEMAELDQPMIVISGAKTWPYLREIAVGLTNQLPKVSHVEVADGENHTISPGPTADAVHAFLSQRSA